MAAAAAVAVVVAVGVAAAAVVRAPAAQQRPWQWHHRTRQTGFTVHGHDPVPPGRPAHTPTHTLTPTHTHTGEMRRVKRGGRLQRRFGRPLPVGRMQPEGRAWHGMQVVVAVVAVAVGAMLLGVVGACRRRHGVQGVGVGPLRSAAS